MINDQLQNISNGEIEGNSSWTFDDSESFYFYLYFFCLFNMKIWFGFYGICHRADFICFTEIGTQPNSTLRLSYTSLMRLFWSCTRSGRTKKCLVIIYNKIKEIVETNRIIGTQTRKNNETRFFLLLTRSIDV